MPKTETVTIRLSPETKAWLTQEAARQDRSIAYLVQKLIEAARTAREGTTK